MIDVREWEGARPPDVDDGACCSELQAEEQERLAEPDISFDFGEAQDEDDRIRDQ